MTIHQPDFMPWLGFFHKIAMADLWIVLDHVKNNPRDAAFWCRRVRVLSSGTPIWVSVPLQKRPHCNAAGIPINEMLVARSLDRNMRKCKDTILQSYARSPYFREITSHVEEYFVTTEESLVRCNMSFVTQVMRLLGINTQIVYSSSLNPQGVSNGMLLDLLLKVGANSYLCGNGAEGYQVDNTFTSNGLQVRKNQFLHPTYNQGGNGGFTAGLSVIDAIAWSGSQDVRRWMTAGGPYPESGSI